MLTLVRKAINASFGILGLECRRKAILTKADDPYHAIALLLDQQETKTIIDAGASIGDTSQRLADLFPRATIHAIEPYPPFYEHLERTTKHNPRIRHGKFALSDQSGHALLQINQSEGTNSLLEANDDGKKVYGDLLSPVAEVKVKTQTLDDFIKANRIEHIDFLKLDLQGGELPALRGATKAMENGSIQCILCEIMFEPHYTAQPTAGALLHELIEKRGFTLFNLYQSHYHHGKILQVDALFLHSSKLSKAEENAKRNYQPYSRFLK